MPLLARACPHVAGTVAPALSAARKEPGDGGPEWCFACAACPLEGAGTDLPLEGLVQRDPALVEIVLHPRGTVLERHEAGGRWHTVEGTVLLPHGRSRRWPSAEPRYPPRPGEPLEDGDLALLAGVAQRGWHVVPAAEEDGRPARAYSVGLFRSFDHPEIIVLGVAADALAEAVDRVGARVRRGERFDASEVARGVVDGRLAVFRPVAQRHLGGWLEYAVWYHGGPRFPALQCVWSDGDGRFPWDPWFPREGRECQPPLFEPETA